MNDAIVAVLVKCYLAAILRMSPVNVSVDATAKGFMTVASMMGVARMRAPTLAPAAGAHPPAGANGQPPASALAANGAGAAAGGGARPPMRWTKITSGFVLRRMKQLIETGARANKGFKEKDVNQVAKALREFSREEVISTQVYNHLRKWRQRWGRVCKLKDLSGALWDHETNVIMLDQDHYAGHVKVFGILFVHFNSSFLFS